MRFACLLPLLVACGTDADPYYEPNDAERAFLNTVGDVSSPPVDPTNALTAEDAPPAAATLGQMLFFDKSYSGALAVGDDGTNGGMGTAGDRGKVSCQSCHAAASDGLDDRRSKPGNVSLGTDYGSRNALPLTNSAFYAWTNWGGRFDSQWSLPLAVAENPKIMNSTRLEIVHMLAGKYRTDYERAFPPITLDMSTLPTAGKPGMPAFDDLDDATKLAVNRIFANYGKALQAYVRRLISVGSRFDQFVGGTEAVFTYKERQGLRVFVEAGCANCHNGPNLADDRFHAIGVKQLGDHVPAMDLGRYADLPALLASPFNTDGVFSDKRDTGKLADLAQADEHKGQFRTKSLRGIAASGPYMHTGSIATLPEVVDFYDRGGDAPEGIVVDEAMQPLGLTLAEKSQLVAFLGTFEGEPLDLALLVDTSK